MKSEKLEGKSFEDSRAITWLYEKCVTETSSYDELLGRTVNHCNYRKR